MKQQIIADFHPDGSVKIEAQGYTGNSCEEATRFLEEGLGVVTERKRKAEYYTRAKTKAKNINRLGS